MKKLLRVLMLGVICAFALSLFLLIGCERQKETKTKERQELVASLREQYPYAKSGTASRTAFSKLFPEKNTWLKAGDYIFRAEVAGNWETYNVISSPTDENGSSMDIEVVFYLLPVHVVELIDARDGQEVPEGIIWIAYSFADFNYDDEERFPVGSSFVFIGSPAIRPTEYKDSTVVGADTLLTFYVTEDNIVLAFGAEQMVDEISGYTYDDFKSFISSISEKSGWHRTN